MNANKAVFLDRDGVLTQDVYYPKWGEWEAAQHIHDIRYCPGAEDALRLLQQAGFLLFLVSNQGAPAKGKVPLKNILDVATAVTRHFAEKAITFQEEFYSYSHPNGRVAGLSGPSLERKPGIYFVLLAEAKYDLDLKKSFFVGDRESDILCGKKAGMHTVLVRSEHAPGLTHGQLLDIVPTIFVDNVYEAASRIIRF